MAEASASRPRPFRVVIVGAGRIGTALGLLLRETPEFEILLVDPTEPARRRAEGCVTVEMEAAAFFAVARFRGIAFAQLLYAGDDVSGEQWAHRRWDRSPSRQLTFDLAVDLALALQPPA